MKFCNIRKALCIVLSLMVFTSLSMPAFAAEEKLDITPSNAKNVEKAILDLIEENKDLTPSVSIAVFNDKEEICNVVYGYADKDGNVEADKETVYEWGSVSKLAVWTSVMQLYEQGKLDLNKDIKEYLPDGFLANLSYDEPITMIDLMNHSAGFQETIGIIDTFDINEYVQLDKALKTTAPAQVTRPGEAVGYSNWTAALAGYIVECISGTEYADYVNKNIFEKLGMEHSYIRPDISDNEWASKQRNNLHCYTRSMPPEKNLIDMGVCKKYINLYPAGSIGGTLFDMELFAKAFLCDSKDCPLFEKEDTLEKMLSPSWTFADGTPKICHGIFYNLNGNGIYGHGGNTEGCSAELWFDIKNKIGHVMMINLQSDRYYTSELPKLLYGEEYAPIGENFEKIDLSGYYKMGRGIYGAGMFKILSPTEDYVKFSKNGDTFVSSNGISKLTQISDTFFEAELINNTKMYFAIKKDANGNVAAIESFNANDFLKVSDFHYYTEWIMIFVFALSVIIMAVLFIVHAVRIRKYKNEPSAKFKKSELLASLAALLVLIEFAVILLNQYLFFDGNIIIRAVFAVILCLLVFAEVFMIIKCHVCKEKPDKRILINIETVCSVLTVICIIYWRMFQWWGF